jgi:branched-chain amino acid transport system substrate-binding protein
MTISRRKFLAGTGMSIAALAMPRIARADNATLKIGMIAPMTGPFTSTGFMLQAGAKLHMAKAGDTVAGRKIELIVRDDTGVADTTRRIAQEMVANDGVEILTGFGLTPLALAVAPISAQAKIAQVVMMSGTSGITAKSPYMIRPAFTQPQTTVPMAEWASRNGISKVATLVADYAPGVDTETAFTKRFAALNGTITTSIRAPVNTSDFAPFLQRAADSKPDALFLFVPTGQGATLMKQFTERGLDKAGIKVIAEGSVTEDDVLTQMDDSVLGVITSHHYSAAHDSPENKEFVAAFTKANDNRRPDHIAVHAYDGMRIVYEALKATGGRTDGDTLVAAMKGQSFTSPRGPLKIDDKTGDPIQNIYIRKVQKVDGALYNVEFETVANVDPSKL